MTIYATTPGCYASSLLYRVDAPECVACKHVAACAENVTHRVGTVLAIVDRLDQKFATARSASVARWFKSRRTRNRVKERKRTSAQATLDGWKRVGLNVYEIKQRMNPAFPTEPGLRATFQCIIDNGTGFTRRDVVEEVTGCTDLTKAAAKRMTDLVCDALVEAGVLKSEPRGILCLN